MFFFLCNELFSSLKKYRCTFCLFDIEISFARQVFVWPKIPITFGFFPNSSTFLLHVTIHWWFIFFPFVLYWGVIIWSYSFSLNEFQEFQNPNIISDSSIWSGNWCKWMCAIIKISKYNEGIYDSNYFNGHKILEFTISVHYSMDSIRRTVLFLSRQIFCFFSFQRSLLNISESMLIFLIEEIVRIMYAGQKKLVQWMRHWCG